MKSENHQCTIEVFKEILKIVDEKRIERFNKIITKLKKNREKAQYYLEPVKSDVIYVEEIVSMVEELKEKILLKKEKISRFIKDLMKLANEEF